MCDGEGLHLPLRRFGNVTVAVQPARGYNIDPKATYHSPDLVPPHNYFALYFWLREECGVDAIVHFGKHGNLEWLPGKALALGASCHPEAIWGQCLTSIHSLSMILVRARRPSAEQPPLSLTI